MEEIERLVQEDFSGGFPYLSLILLFIIIMALMSIWNQIHKTSKKSKKY